MVTCHVILVFVVNTSAVDLGTVRWWKVRGCITGVPDAVDG